MTRIVAYGCLALSMALVGSYVALSKPLVAVFPVFLLAWLRFGLGGLGMLAWLRKPPAEAPLSRTTRRLLFAQSLFGNFLFSICMLLGMRLSSAVAAGVVMAAIPAAVALMSWLFLGEQVGPRVWLATACAVAGVALVSVLGADPAQAPSASWLGSLLLVGAVLCEAAYAVIGKKLTGDLSAKRITALINLWGLALMTPLGLWAAWGFDFSSVALPLWALLVFYALAASVWSVWLWMTGLQAVPAQEAGIFTVMLPISAAGVGVFALGEQLNTGQAVGFALALAGVALATWRPRQPVAESVRDLRKPQPPNAS